MKLIQIIVKQSNLYCYQKFEKVLWTNNVKEIKNLIGILLIMGIVKMPAYTDYWAPVTNVMSMRRYQ